MKHFDKVDGNRKCPFCTGTQELLTRSTFFKHIERHLCDLALAILPQDNASDSGSSTSSSNDEDDVNSESSREAKETEIEGPSRPPRPILSEATSDKPAQVEPEKPEVQPCRYKTGKTLGTGYYSVVKECVHIETGKFFATKQMNKTLLRGKEYLVSTNFFLHSAFQQVFK